MDELTETSPNSCIWALCGNKMDTPPGSHTVSLQDCSQLAKKKKITVYGEVSAKTKENLDSFFLKLATEIYASRDTFDMRRSGTVKLKRDVI